MEHDGQHATRDHRRASGGAVSAAPEPGGPGRGTGLPPVTDAFDDAAPPLAAPPVPTGDPLVFPPSPVASGEVFDEDGAAQQVTSIEIVITTADGNRIRLPLAHAHGAWWLPRD